MKVDLHFPIVGTKPIASDHGYELFGAISRVLPWLHESPDVGVHPIRGTQLGDRQLGLTDQSSVTLRLNDTDIGQVLSLAGKSIALGNVRLQIGVPAVWSLKPATSLRSRVVTTKNCLEIDRFLTEIRRQLDELTVSSSVIVTPGKRRTFRVRDKQIVGHELLVEGLSAEESIAIQERGLGGRRHMGCGVFVPATKRHPT